MSKQKSDLTSLALIFAILFFCCVISCIALSVAVIMTDQRGGVPKNNNFWSTFEDKFGENSFLVGDEFEVKFQKTDKVKYYLTAEDVFSSSCFYDAEEKNVICRSLRFESVDSPKGAVRIDFLVGNTEAEYKDAYHSIKDTSIINDKLKADLWVNGSLSRVDGYTIKRENRDEVFFCVDSLKTCGLAFPDNLKSIDEYGVDKFWDEVVRMVSEINLSNSTSTEQKAFKELVADEILTSQGLYNLVYVQNIPFQLPSGWLGQLKEELTNRQDPPNGFCENKHPDEECGIVRVENSKNKYLNFVFSYPDQYNVLPQAGTCHDEVTRKIQFGDELVTFNMIHSSESVAEEDSFSCPEFEMSASNFSYLKGCRSDNICIWGTAGSLDDSVKFIEGLEEK